MKLKQFESFKEYLLFEDEMVTTNEPCALMIKPQTTEVVTESEECCNIDYCNEHNIPYFVEKYVRASCIVYTKGNICVIVKRHNINGKALGDVFSIALCDYLKEKGLPSVKCDNNDVMVDGYKVASGIEGEIDGYRYMGYQISLNQDMKTIENVCKKTMVKNPKGLSDWGLTTEEMAEFCNNFWKKY